MKKTQLITQEIIASAVKVRTPVASRTQASLNLCFGVCRSGTTALAQIYGKARCKSFYQPAKSDYRLVAYSQPPINLVKLLRSDARSIFIKETIGPLRPFEHEIDFLGLYSQLGFKLEDAHIIIAIRNPGSTFGSWLRKWRPRASRAILFRNYIECENTLVRLEKKAVELGLTISYCARQIAGENHQVFRTIFARSNPPIEYKKSYFHNWRFPDFTKSKKVKFGREPIETYVADLHSTLSYYHAGELHPPATFYPSETSALLMAGVFQSWYRRLNLATKDAINTTYVME